MVLSELSDQKSWNGSSEEPRECLGKKETKSSHRADSCRPVGGAEGGRGPYRGHSRVQGEVAGFRRETLGPPQAIGFFQSRHGPHRFHPMTSVTKAKLTPGAIRHPKFQRQLRPGPGPELSKPVIGSLSKFQSCLKWESWELCSLTSLEARTGWAALGRGMPCV